jgi:hypothetical protein
MSYRAFEQITVGAAAVGFTEATIVEGGGHRQVTHVLARCRTAELSYRVDGGTPTASVGILLEVGDVLKLDDVHEIRRFRAIRTGSSGQLDCAYSDEPMGSQFPMASVTASGMALEAGGNLAAIAAAVFAEDAAHTSGDKGVQMLAVRQDSAAALAGTTGDYIPLSTSAGGALRIAPCKADGTIVEPVADIAHGAADSGNPAKIGGKANAAAPAAVDEGDRVDASFDPQGRLRVVKDAGLTGYRSIDLDESEEEVKATAGRVAWIWFSNLHATDARYLKFYNLTAANTTVGTSTPVHTFRLRGATDGTIAIPEGGLIFDTAISMAATTALADADTGAPGAGEVLINLGYR